MEFQLVEKIKRTILITENYFFRDAGIFSSDARRTFFSYQKNIFAKTLQINFRKILNENNGATGGTYSAVRCQGDERHALLLEPQSLESWRSGGRHL